ncbi:MAG: hypothetical protein FIA93_04795 [Deltaproteobacteria bacterium]|nr:hypothetical protein [Deltaproteobacteria bacterium]
MNMIDFYSRQIRMLRRGNSGQAAALFLTTISAILALVFSTLFTAHLNVEKVASSNAVAAIALSAATWEARGLNLIASLNAGILQCLRAIRGICVVWAALAIAACLGAGMSEFIAYSRRAPRMIRSYWNCAKQLEAWSGKVKDLTPYLVLAETASLSRTLKVSGMLCPLDPRGPHDGKNTLELHLKPGPPLTLTDAMSPLTGITGKIGKWKWVKNIVRAVTAVIDAAVRSILVADTTPIRMLEPEEDFTRRQKVRFAGIKSASPLPIPSLAQQEARGFFMDSHAEPYGGGIAEMTWKSRLTDAPEKP